MGMFTAMNAAGSGLTAERLRMDIISNNIANVNSTRTEEGGPYRRQRAVFTPRKMQTGFSIPMPRGINDQLGAQKTHKKHIPFEDAEAGPRDDRFKGVKIVKVDEDPSPFRMEYQPGHPDADENGYIAMPNVNIVSEMTDMISASRAYEANVSTIKSAKNMFSKALTIGR
ncbi:flagellar basal body rod protein FlgC [bacterium]|nr:flagellar basal body rod protein FlgC [bacterium]